jgi:hypothetical protein
MNATKRDTEGFRIVNSIKKTLSSDSDALMMHYDNQWLTRGDVREFVTRLDRVLADNRVGPSASIGVMMRNRPGLVSSFRPW